MNFLYGALLFIGLGLSYLAKKQYIKSKDHINSGVKTTAKVIKMIVETGESNNMYKPVFEYFDKSNKVYTYTSSVSSYPPQYKIGDKIQVIYNPKNKEEVRKISYWGLYGAVIILLSIAMPFIIIGGGYFLYLQK